MGSSHVAGRDSNRRSRRDTTDPAPPGRLTSMMPSRGSAYRIAYSGWMRRNFSYSVFGNELTPMYAYVRSELTAAQKNE